jgi:hypothetical protein
MLGLCQQYLNCYDNKHDTFLHRIITGSITENRRVKDRFGIETSTIIQQEKVQNPTIHGKTDVYRFLGITKPANSTISGEGHNNKQFLSQWNAY